MRHRDADPSAGAGDLIEEEPDGLPSYYLTFSDMMTLLFAFFVILVGLASFDPDRRAAVASSIRESFPTVELGGGKAPGFSAAGASGIGGRGNAPGTLPGGAPAEVFRQVRDRLNAEGLGSVEVVPRGDGVLIRLESNLLFPSGSDRVHPGGERLVAAIARAVSDLPGRIRVEGHTDDVPIKTAQFPTNWELSAARAIRVVRLLTEEHGIDPKRVSFAGFGEFQPLVPNDSAENRQRNRRVEVFLVGQTGP